MNTSDRMDTNETFTNTRIQPVKVEDFKICISSLKDVAPKTLVTNSYEWPLFKEWFIESVESIITDVNLDEVFTLTEAPSYNLGYLGLLLFRALKMYFAPMVYKDFRGMKNLNFFIRANNKFSKISNYEKAQLFYDFDHNHHKMSRDQTIKELAILEYYIDGIKPLINLIFCTKIKKVDLATFFKELKIYDGDSLTEKRFKEFTPSELSSLYDRYMKETRPNSYEKEEDVYFAAQSNNSNRGKFNGNNSRSAPKSDGNGKNGGKDTKGDKNKTNKKKVKCQNCGKMGHSANKCYSNKQTHFVQSELENDSSDESCVDKRVPQNQYCMKSFLIISKSIAIDESKLPTCQSFSFGDKDEKMTLC